MLYSPSADIGFAHYPKTAGHSVGRWFREVFPDARLVEPHPFYEVNHLPVRESLERLGRVPRSNAGTDRSRRLLRRLRPWISAAWGRPAAPRCATRIIGVLREPFDMLVSLFEYWRSFDFAEEPDLPVIRSARSGRFREFLRAAVVDGEIPDYLDFFDMRGPASANTRLLDFHSLEPALRKVCREFGLPTGSLRLGRLNAGPRGGPNLDAYREEAGELMRAVQRRFRWYYRTGVRVMVRGPRSTANEGRGPARRHGWLPDVRPGRTLDPVGA